MRLELSPHHLHTAFEPCSGYQLAAPGRVAPLRAARSWPRKYLSTALSDLHLSWCQGRRACLRCSASDERPQSSSQSPPPPRRMYRGTAGSPTSYPIGPKSTGKASEEDDDDYEYINVGPQYQVPQPELGPLEKRVSMGFVPAMLSDKVNLEETKYWFTCPPGGWEQGDKYIRAAKRIPNNLNRNASHAGPGRTEIYDLQPGQILKGKISALWLFEGVQVDIGAQWDGLIAVYHERWDTIRHQLMVGQEITVRVFRVIPYPRCKFPLQLQLVEPEHLIPLMLRPLDYEFPFDLEGLETIEEKEIATGLQWEPQSDVRRTVTEEELNNAKESMSPDFAAELQAKKNEMESLNEVLQVTQRRWEPTLLVDAQSVDQETMYTWGAL